MTVGAVAGTLGVIGGTLTGLDAASGPSGPAAFGTTLAYRWIAYDIAQADGSAVASWPAAAGGQPIAQSTGARQPTVNTFTNNSKTFKGVVFSAGQLLQALAASMPNPATVYYVVRDRQTASNEGVIQDGASSSGRNFLASTNGSWRGYAGSSIVGPAAVLNGWQVIIVGFSASAGFFRLNGTKTGGALNFGSQAITGGLNVGADDVPSRWFAGDIAEIGYLTGLPSDTDLARNIDSYVQDTYGITVADYDPTWADNPGGGGGGPTGVTDTFDRANSTTDLGAASDGGTWSQDGTWGISSNAAYMPATGGPWTGFGRALRDLGKASCDITVNATNAGGSGGIAFAVDRGGAETGYEVLWTNSDAIFLNRVSGSGARTSLKFGGSAVGSTPATIRVTYDSATGAITVYQNGTAVISYTDASKLAGTWVGMASNRTSSDRWLDFTAV